MIVGIFYKRYIYIYIYIYILWRCPWCNGYRRRKWTRVQIQGEKDCISHCTNTLGKGMNPIILPPAMGKYSGRLGSSDLVKQLEGIL